MKILAIPFAHARELAIRKLTNAAAAVSFEDCPSSICKLNMTTGVVRTILKHKNYDVWSSQIKTYLLAEDLWDIIDEGTDECPKTEDKEKAQGKAWKKKDAKALYAIQNSCGDDTYQLIKNKTTAKEAWNTLSKNLEKPGGPSKEKVYMSVGEAYPTPTLIDDDTKPEVSMEEGRTEGARHHMIQETFVKYVKSNDWRKATNLLRQHPQAATATVSLDGTALHYAIKKGSSVCIIQQLVELMAAEDLEITGILGCTALHSLIRNHPERVEVAKCMVQKNHNLLTILPKWNKKPLVVVAQRNTKGEQMARYLYSLTPPETIKVIDAAQLISDGFRLQRFDIAWDLIQRYPKLAIATNHDGDIPLGTLAKNHFAFKSGRPLNLWEELIYYGIRIKPLPLRNKDDSHIIIDVREPESEQRDQGPLSDQKENQRHHLISPGMGLFQRLVANLQTLLGINHIYQIKLIHERVEQFLPRMCDSVRKENMGDYQKRKLDEALCVAVERGHVEYITHLLSNSSYPVFEVANEKLQSLLQIAAECRRYNVYNDICELLQKQDKDGLNQLGELKAIMGNTDRFGNNLLHTVARITPLSRIYYIQGAALQMQRELQWFKKVESIANVKDHESVNNDNKTPREVFTENHKEMWKEAKNSMKETANSCTIVGALIITIMFAAIFTVPGGYDEGTGLPVFLTKEVFIIFLVSDALSLFSSTTSVIMFLGVITSRYNEDVFHGSLPTKMIIGLFTLLLSIVTMMIVFSCALYIMFDGKSSIVIPTILVASVPVTSYLWMQFPLLVESFLLLGLGAFEF